MSHKARIFGISNSLHLAASLISTALLATSLIGVGVVDEDHDDNQPPAPIYLDDGDNYPIVPITPTGDQDHCHDHNDR